MQSYTTYAKLYNLCKAIQPNLTYVKVCNLNPLTCQVNHTAVAALNAEQYGTKEDSHALGDNSTQVSCGDGGEQGESTMKVSDEGWEGRGG